MTRLTIAALAALLLSACATLDGKLDNRIACTVAGDKLFALSEWGPVSIGSRISDLDRAAVCKAPEAAAKPASAASGAK